MMARAVTSELVTAAEHLKRGHQVRGQRSFERGQTARGQRSATIEASNSFYSWPHIVVRAHSRMAGAGARTARSAWSAP
jgi:hypothetical protein